MVEDHLWSANRKRYVTAQINGTTHSFHNVVMNNPGILMLILLIKIPQTAANLIYI